MNTRMDFLAQQIAVEMRKEGRRMSIQTVEEFFALVRPFYVALEPEQAKALATVAAPVAEMAPPDAASLEAQRDAMFDKLGL